MKPLSLFLGNLGNRLSSKKGLTFIEVMVTSVVLSAGLVAVFRSFLVGVDYLDHLSCRLSAFNLIESRIAAIERDFTYLAKQDIGPAEEVVLVNNRPISFHYNIKLVPVGELLSVFRLDVDLSWEDKGRRGKTSRSAYFSALSSHTTGG